MLYSGVMPSRQRLSTGRYAGYQELAEEFPQAFPPIGKSYSGFTSSTAGDSRNQSGREANAEAAMRQGCPLRRSASWPISQTPRPLAGSWLGAITAWVFYSKMCPDAARMPSPLIEKALRLRQQEL